MVSSSLGGEEGGVKNTSGKKIRHAVLSVAAAEVNKVHSGVMGKFT
jgi:hypothetical protein